MSRNTSSVPGSSEVTRREEYLPVNVEKFVLSVKVNSMNLKSGETKLGNQSDHKNEPSIVR